MSKPVVIGLAVLVLAGAPRGAGAGANINAKLVIHLTQPTGKTACTTFESTPSCANVVSQGSLYPPNGYFAYVLVMDANATAGIAGVQFGISYDNAPHSGVDIFSWNLCGTLEFRQPTPVWPASLSGNMVTWDWTNACQRYEPGGPGAGVVAAVGYFYLAAYSPDRLAIIPRPIDGLAAVADCQAQQDDVYPSYYNWGCCWRLGSAGFDRPACEGCGMYDNPGCPRTEISGESTVVEWTGGHVYTAPPGSSFTRWQVGGNATITEQLPGSVTVTAGGIEGGTKFWVDFDAGSTSYATHGFKLVTIQAPVPVQPATWSGVKTLHR